MCYEMSQKLTLQFPLEEQRSVHKPKENIKKENIKKYENIAWNNENSDDNIWYNRVFFYSRYERLRSVRIWESQMNVSDT